jgi:Flp pilus assembly protein TadG
MSEGEMKPVEMMKMEMDKRRKWLRRGEAGQALVEAAVTAPVLFLLLFGAAELARIAYTAIEVANAAQAGVEYATQNEFTMTDNPSNTNMTSNGTTTSAGDDAANVSGLTTTASTGYVCSDGSTASNTSTSNPTCPNGSVGAIAIPYITVTASAKFDPLVYLPGLPSSFTLSSSATESCVDCN